VRPLLWAAGIAASERAARRLFPRRTTALLIAYAALAVAAGATASTDGRRRRGPPSAGAVALALGGYPLGRALAGDPPSGPPPDGLARELVALGLVVAIAEEAAWGRHVEEDLGVPATGLLFSLKHALVDGRWRRSAGLAAFWVGLGGVRKASRAHALALHVVCNSAAVLLGHAIARDQF
jgi:hypothetical protein